MVESETSTGATAPAAREEARIREFDIVRATPTDVPLLAEYRFAMFVEMHPGTDLSAVREKFLEAAARYYREKLSTHGEVSLVARRGSEPIGCGSIMFQERPPNVKRMTNLFGYILNICVRPEWRKRGVATAVVRALEAEAKKRGVKRIGLHASAAGAPLYSRLGYAHKESYMEVEL